MTAVAGEERNPSSSPTIFSPTHPSDRACGGDGGDDRPRGLALRLLGGAARNRVPGDGSDDGAACFPARATLEAYSERLSGGLGLQFRLFGLEEFWGFWTSRDICRCLRR